MPQGFVVIKLVLVFLYGMSEHNSKQNPRPDIKSIQSYIYFSRSFSNIGKVRPVKFFISCSYYSIRNPVQIFACIHSKNIFSLNLSSFCYSLLCLLVVFFCDNIQLLNSVSQGFLLIFQLIGCSSKFVSQLFVLLMNFLISTRQIFQLLFQNVYLGFLTFYYLTILILFGFNQCVKFRIVHKHLLLYFGKSNQYLFLKILPLCQGIIHEFFHPVDLDKKLSICNLLMPQVKESLLQTFCDSDQCAFNLLDRFAVKVYSKLNFKLFANQKQMLLDFEHELIYNSIHILHNRLPTDILLDLFRIFAIQGPI